jgi:outer membrane protein TolC
MAVPSQVGWRLLLIVGGGCIVLGLSFGTKAFAQTETLPAPNNASPQAGQPGREPKETPGSRSPPVDKDVQGMPIDLATALRLANAGNPTINLARERVREAYANLLQAQVLWLPNLQTGPAYVRHDGMLQNSRGEVFPTDKWNFFIGGGAAMTLETSDALFAPLIARRLVQAQEAAALATRDNVQLDVALGYLELLRVYGALAINEDMLGRLLYLSKNADAADKQGLTRSKADPIRAQAQVSLTREERFDIEGQAALAAARLAQLLLLQPTVDLRPADPAIVPITLVPVDGPLDELVATGLMNRPELAESRALVAAALARWRQARVGPLLPRLEVSYFAGDFGGGINDNTQRFGGRGDGTAQAVWELRNLGFGDLARARVGRSRYDQANLHVLEIQAQVAAEVTAAAKLVRSRDRALGTAQEAVRQAQETWRRLRIAAFGIQGRDQSFNTLEPLIAVQTLDQARKQYLTQVIEYTRAQFRLYTAMGQPPLDALAKTATVPVAVEAAPPPYVAPPPPRFQVPPPPKP